MTATKTAATLMPRLARISGRSPRCSARIRKTFLRRKCRRLNQGGTFGYLERTITTAELNKFLPE